MVSNPWCRAQERWRLECVGRLARFVEHRGWPGAPLPGGAVVPKKKKKNGERIAILSPLWVLSLSYRPARPKPQRF